MIAFTTSRIRRGWYRLIAFTVKDGVRTYQLKGIAEVRKKKKELEKLEAREKP